jgi:hypothetical protein
MTFEELRDAAEAARAARRQVVAVLGLGFVGTAVVANLARTRAGGAAGAGAPLFCVLGLDRDDAAGREKVERLNDGVPPAYADDPTLERVVRPSLRSEGLESPGSRAITPTHPSLPAASITSPTSFLTSMSSSRKRW